jgi:hypothetical protein
MLFLNVAVLFLGAIFSWLPTVDTLPTIIGYDIDGLLNLGAGYVAGVLQAFWPLGIMFQGFLALMVYFSIKMVLRFFLGSRV